MATEKVGTKLRALREARGWSQGELARRAKMHRSHIERIEDGSFGHPRPPTLQKLASALNCEVEELTGKATIRQVTPYERNPEYRMLIDALETAHDEDRSEILRHALWAVRRARRAEVADVGEVITFPTFADADGDFPPLPIAPEDFIEKDTDAPRPLHAWIVPVSAEAAAGTPRNPDDILVPTTQLLNTFREVRDERTHVIKIFGDSMHPTLRNGWKVLIDPAKSLFQPGKIVMVYLRDEGSTIGLLAKNGDRFKIVKRNAEYGGPVEIPLTPGEWYPVGTVTTIVEAPVEIE